LKYQSRNYLIERENLFYQNGYSVKNSKTQILHHNLPIVLSRFFVEKTFSPKYYSMDGRFRVVEYIANQKKTAVIANKEKRFHPYKTQKSKEKNPLDNEKLKICSK